MFTDFGIDKGHQLPGVDTGAVGIKKEDDLNKLVGDKVIEYLKTMGKTVTDCTPLAAPSLGESLYLRVTTANRDNVGLFVSIHFNIGGGYGSEVYAMSEPGVTVARRVLDKLLSLGFKNRGINDGSWLYVVRNTDSPATSLRTYR
jgi:N-acetylmuramoyl-L-alanine amidase